MVLEEKKQERGAEQEVLEASHVAARPMKVVVDEEGSPWLCDDDVDPHRNLASQGCWRCGDMAFTRND